MKKIRVVFPLISIKKEIKDDVVIYVSDKYKDIKEATQDIILNKYNAPKKFELVYFPKDIDLRNYNLNLAVLTIGEVEDE